jgi:hypothetical protein
MNSPDNKKLIFVFEGLEKIHLLLGTVARILSVDCSSSWAIASYLFESIAVCKLEKFVVDSYLASKKTSLEPIKNNCSIPFT